MVRCYVLCRVVFFVRLFCFVFFFFWRGGVFDPARRLGGMCPDPGCVFCLLTCLQGLDLAQLFPGPLVTKTSS